MNVTDPIADMLTRIRNASVARHRELSMPSSRVKREIARILADEGFIASFETRTDPPPCRISSCCTSSTSRATRPSSPG